MTVTIKRATKDLASNVIDYVADLIETTIEENADNTYNINMKPDMFMIGENSLSSTLTITMWDSDSDIALIRANYFDFRDIAIN